MKNITVPFSHTLLRISKEGILTVKGLLDFEISNHDFYEITTFRHFHLITFYTKHDVFPPKGKG